MLAGGNGGGGGGEGWGNRTAEGKKCVAGGLSLCCHMTFLRIRIIHRLPSTSYTEKRKTPRFCVDPLVSVNFCDFLTPTDAVKENPQKYLAAEKILLTQPVGTASKCTKDAKTVYVALVMVSIWGRKMTLADKTVYRYGSVDTNFDPPWFSLDSTFKGL